MSQRNPCVCLELAIDYGGEFALLTMLDFVDGVRERVHRQLLRVCKLIKSGCFRSIPVTFGVGFLMYFASGDNSYIDLNICTNFDRDVQWRNKRLVHLFAGYFLRRLKGAVLF
jgi:hypothetical protein